MARAGMGVRPGMLQHAPNRKRMRLDTAGNEAPSRLRATGGTRGTKALESIVPNTTKQARHAAAKVIARDLGIDIEEAEYWCDAWVRFAKNDASGRYYWDSARGWIDAQRSFEQDDVSPRLERAG